VAVNGGCVRVAPHSAPVSSHAFSFFCVGLFGNGTRRNVSDACNTSFPPCMIAFLFSYFGFRLVGGALEKKKASCILCSFLL
jgi:hypothetical protein